MSEQISKSYLRSIAKFLDGKNYFETFVENNQKRIKLLKSQLKREVELSDNSDVEEILMTLYEFVSKEYPNDIIYKINFLECVDDFIDNPINSYIVNEFKFGRSITDLAVFNGKSISFEIKSDLDKADNIVDQFKEYEKVFDYSYLITREDRIKDLKSKLPVNAGIIVLDKYDNFALQKIAKENNNISFEKLFRILRKEEYLDIVRYFYGSVPNVPNTRLFSESYRLLKEVKFEDFKREFLRKLKYRDYSVYIPDLKEIKKTKRQGFISNSKLLNK